MPDSPGERGRWRLLLAAPARSPGERGRWQLLLAAPAPSPGERGRWRLLLAAPAPSPGERGRARSPRYAAGPCPPWPTRSATTAWRPIGRSIRRSHDADPECYRALDPSSQPTLPAAGARFTLLDLLLARASG